MKALLPNAVFIGFTGTPLLKQDAQTSLEVFGGYIHTYKFSEGVEDEVILDLIYEARDIDQHVGSQDKIDAWFDAKTKGLNDWQKDVLKEKWGTMQNVLSSRSRMDRVVSDVVFDFNVKPRLSSERGNAILVASSIYEACRYFAIFQKTEFKGKCAVVTSYNPDDRVLQRTALLPGDRGEVQCGQLHRLLAHRARPDSQTAVPRAGRGTLSPRRDGQGVLPRPPRPHRGDPVAQLLARLQPHRVPVARHQADGDPQSLLPRLRRPYRLVRGGPGPLPRPSRAGQSPVRLLPRPHD